MFTQRYASGRFLLIAFLLGIFSVTSLRAGLAADEQDADPDTRPPVTAASAAKGEELFAKLVENNERRTRELQQYSATRRYEVSNDNGKSLARQVVKVEFHAPDVKKFETVSEEGSGFVRRMVFNGLMKSEEEAAAGKERRDSSITPHNYTFTYFGEQYLDGRHCYVVYAVPARKDKYLFEGLVWIDSQDFAVAKIAGHPAKNPSFWIKRVEWVRRYAKVGDFWLPAKDETLTEVKIFGKKRLTIEYQDYAVNRPAAAGHDLASIAEESPQASAN